MTPSPKQLEHHQPNPHKPTTVKTTFHHISTNHSNAIAKDLRGNGIPNGSRYATQCNRVPHQQQQQQNHQKVRVCDSEQGGIPEIPHIILFILFYQHATLEDSAGAITCPLCETWQPTFQWRVRPLCFAHWGWPFLLVLFFWTCFHSAEKSLLSQQVVLGDEGWIVALDDIELFKKAFWKWPIGIIGSVSAGSKNALRM